MRFQDYGVILRIISFEETKFIITVLTRENGIYPGLTDTTSSVWTHIYGEWSSRTQTLGYWSWEEAYTKNVSDYKTLLSIQTVCSLLSQILPERHPYPALYDALANYFDIAQFPDLLFSILEETGYGFTGNMPDKTEQRVSLAFELLSKHFGFKPPHLLVGYECKRA